ncbi:NUDIX domain-containing protein [Streptosporangium sp. NPDC048047]|uniref:NUDIX hydrolase n=1 Tax=Streptosporangium sp. NPDC048047 TaxID=3155748 RepID=UPI00342B3378
MPEATPRDPLPGAVVRPSARVLLLDGRDRVLLFRGRGLVKGSDLAWFTPGGGVNPGEDLAVAAARELREETGQVTSPEDLGPVVAVSRGHWTDLDDRLFYARDHYFLLRVPEPSVDVSGMEDLERSLMDTFRWWTLPELRTTGDHVIPPGLSGLLDRLLTGGLPAEPLVLPWHHPEPPP